jgi:hypothetical protein
MRTLAAALLLATAGPALAVEVNGVKVPESVVVDGMALQLNGAGVRKKFIVKVYVGALYLPRRMSDPAAIVALDQPKSVRMFLLRDLDRSSLLDAIRDGFESNSKAQLPELEPKLKLLEEGLPPEVKEGQVVQVAYAPGRGCTVAIEGGKSVTVEGKVFGDALFRVWLGEDPVDSGLKEAMLAK